MSDVRGPGRRTPVWLAVIGSLTLLVGATFQETNGPEQDQMVVIEDLTPEAVASETPMAEPTEVPVVSTPSLAPEPLDPGGPSPTPTPGTPTPVRPILSTPGTRTPTTVVRGEPPAPPATVIIRAIAIGTVGLEWKDSSDNEQGFRIDVSGPMTFSRTVAPNTVEYNIGGLRSGTYCFAVVAFNQDGDSPAVTVCIGVR